MKKEVQIGGYFHIFLVLFLTCVILLRGFLDKIGPFFEFFFSTTLCFLIFFTKIYFIFGGLAFTPNYERLPFFCWDTLVELPLLIVSRHKCSTPHQNAPFPKFHHMPKHPFFIGGFNA
jgi:hypothetical protein